MNCRYRPTLISISARLITELIPRIFRTQLNHIHQTNVPATQKSPLPWSPTTYLRSISHTRTSIRSKRRCNIRSFRTIIPNSRFNSIFRQHRTMNYHQHLPRGGFGRRVANVLRAEERVLWRFQCCELLRLHRE